MFVLRSKNAVKREGQVHFCNLAFYERVRIPIVCYAGSIPAPTHFFVDETNISVESGCLW